jgi:hypothetical protein
MNGGKNHMGLKDLNVYPRNIKTYGGNAGAKFGIVMDDKDWILKFPRNTKELTNVKISYTTSPLSEYLGSKIYQSLGIPVHKVELGLRKSLNSSQNKVVVACQDFLTPGEVLQDFHQIKNAQFYADGTEGTGGSGTELSEVLETIDASIYFETIKEKTVERFWDMFVVDYLISNNDRNNTNWGVISDGRAVKDLAPVFDNGGAFFNKRGDLAFEKAMKDEKTLNEDVFQFYCVFKENGDRIKASEFIQSKTNKDCNSAVARILEKLDFSKIQEIFDSVPAYDAGLSVLSEDKKSYLLKVIKNKIELVLEPTLEK